MARGCDVYRQLWPSQLRVLCVNLHQSSPSGLGPLDLAETGRLVNLFEAFLRHTATRRKWHMLDAKKTPMPWRRDGVSGESSSDFQARCSRKGVGCPALKGKFFITASSAATSARTPLPVPTANVNVAFQWGSH